MYSEYTPDDGQRNSLKHVEFHARIKFVKLVHLVGFIKNIFFTMHGHMNVKLTRQFGNAGLGLALCGLIQGDLVRCFICEFKTPHKIKSNFKKNLALH